MIEWEGRWLDGATPQENMTLDEELLQSCQDGTPPLLRGYRWRQPAISYGYAQRVDGLAASAERAGVALVRRPTGGGLVVHGGDLCYSLIVPRAKMGSMRGLFALAGERVQAAMSAFGVSAHPAPAEMRSEACAAGSLTSDVVVNGRKIAGCAGRRTRQALLVQGYVALDEPPAETMRLLPAALQRRIEERGTTLVECTGRSCGAQEFFEALQRCEALVHAM